MRGSRVDPFLEIRRMSKSTEKTAQPRDIFEMVLAHLELERAMGQDALPRKKGVRLLFQDKSSLTPFPDAGEFLERRAAEIADCTLCALSQGRTQVVYGVGNPDADVMFIGEAPGFNEDQQGRPFVGAAGHLLDELLASICLDRKKVYIANIIKCRPYNNRDPLPREITNCQDRLERQIEIIMPRVIVTLGRYSLASYFPGKSISRVHGTSQEYKGITYFAMYHPAAALHQQNLHKTILEDIGKLPAILERCKPKKPSGKPPPQEQQLGMFEM